MLQVLARRGEGVAVGQAHGPPAHAGPVAVSASLGIDIRSLAETDALGAFARFPHRRIVVVGWSVLDFIDQVGHVYISDGRVPAVATVRSCSLGPIQETRDLGNNKPAHVDELPALNAKGRHT